MEDLNHEGTKTQGRGFTKAFALLALVLVVRLGPGAKVPALVALQMHRGAQRLVAHAAEKTETLLAALVRHRRGARITLRRLRILVHAALRAHLARQARRELGLRARQRLEDEAVGVAVKRLPDLAALLRQLRLQRQARNGTIPAEVCPPLNEHTPVFP